MMLNNSPLLGTGTAFFAEDNAILPHGTVNFPVEDTVIGVDEDTVHSAVGETAIFGVYTVLVAQQDSVCSHTNHKAVEVNSES